MTQISEAVSHHISTPSWRITADGQPRGYIQPESLDELWIHTGTLCNLRCPFCLEGSKPGDNRLEQITFDEIAPYLDEAVELGVSRFSFTGGEPFANRDIFRILERALALRPCLVLTNGTAPLQRRVSLLAPLLARPYPLRLRISLDYPDPAAHDRGRGSGSFDLALKSLGEAYRMGAGVSIARLGKSGEDKAATDAAYAPYLRRAGVPEDTHITVFPDFHPPFSCVRVPEITETCMKTYHTAESRASFMCHFSKMLVKAEGRIRVVACTLVDDDPDYDLGQSLSESLKYRIMLKHHRCFSCFACGASCSEG